MASQKRKRVIKKKVSQKKAYSLLPFLHKLFSYKNKVILSLGIAFMLVALAYKADQHMNAVILSKKAIINSCVENKSLPSTLIIPELDMSAQIEESSVVGSLWQISSQNVSHLNSSAVPGENGNVIIYGHNSKNQFSQLKLLKNGSYITLKTKENRSYTYIVQSKIIVFPSDTRLIKDTDKEALTIYTCDGLLDSLRLVIRAVPVYEKVAQAGSLVCLNAKS